MNRTNVYCQQCTCNVCTIMYNELICNGFKYIWFGTFYEKDHFMKSNLDGFFIL